MDRVIPPFYACYLLRSTVRHQNLYVGSTPHPARRLKQHNGLAKGGAVRTSRDSLRPWEMTCLVTGFPSKIAALQFEWAWQNTHQTRHIAVGERITQTQQRTKVSPKTGRSRKKTGRPRMSLTDKLANLHILLRSKSFEHWPLEVRFFAPDVFRFWERTTAKTTELIRHGIKIGMDQSTLNQSIVPGEVNDLVGIQALNVTFEPMKSVLERSRMLLNSRSNECAICREALDTTTSMLLVCYAEGCESIFHMKCLSKHFLGSEQRSESLLPTESNCPTCKTSLQWTDLVRDLSLRTRGEREIAALYKERKSRKKNDKAVVMGSAAIDDDNSDSELTEMSEVDLDLTEPILSSGLQDVNDLQPTQQDEIWHDVDSLEYLPGNPPRTVQKRLNADSGRCQQEIVIEDSDWDEAEVII